MDPTNQRKVGSGEITTGTVLNLARETLKMWLKILRSLSPFKDKLQKENLSDNDLVSKSIRKQTESARHRVRVGRKKILEEAV